MKPISEQYFSAARRMGLTGVLSVDMHDSVSRGEPGRYVYTYGGDSITTNRAKLFVPQIYAMMEEVK